MLGTTGLVCLAGSQLFTGKELFTGKPEFSPGGGEAFLNFLSKVNEIKCLTWGH